MKSINLQAQSHDTDLIKAIIDLVYDGIVIINQKGIITMISEPYCKFLGYMNDQEIIGRHCSDVIENTRLHIVLESGEPEIAQLQKIGGSYMIASRIPVYKNGKIIGVVGKVDFRNITDLDNLNHKITAMERELQGYKNELNKANQSKYTLDSIIGNSPAIISVKDLARKAAHSDSSILITGESGTGKELFAHAIHHESSRACQPFVKINCGAIPSELLESELFGYEGGSFTGAEKGGKIGKFQVAAGGTIFLDEIGELPVSMQVKLLRVLQEQEIERIGSSEPVKIDVRVITATNRSLPEAVASGHFREDLFYRINVINLQVPPLRERLSDLPLLCSRFIDKYAYKFGKKARRLSPGALRLLQSYDWPGNVRELENIIERALNIMENEDTILPAHLPHFISDDSDTGDMLPLKDALEQTERSLIARCLVQTGGNKSKTSELLQLNRTTLYEKIKKYNL
ncbi:sigma 54-interacting transcriptional regulator [Eubacterium sp. 1001713B170207_170306_E7]|uniref:sigma-54 interaction domain-containing protein n=1 Tax=Eubacterium sp. 1001713B170207_170306_E7 TaxID=2787097 RepID=UPI001896DDD8|nr:sigma 54-interacting transcriptional regulator [Eubacterium sp. 1001713B170207_170306_E7]